MKFKESEMLELKKSTSELKESVVSIAAMLSRRSKLTWTSEWRERHKHQQCKVYFGIKNDGVMMILSLGAGTKYGYVFPLWRDK